MECYNYLQKVLPERYSLKDPLESLEALFQSDIVEGAFPNNLGRNRRLILSAKNYIDHLETVIERIGANAIDHNISRTKSVENAVFLQSKLIEKIRVEFLKNYTIEKPITDYSFCLSNSSDDESTSKWVDCSTSAQNITSSDYSTLTDLGLNTAPINNNCNSVLFIPINVQPTVKGTPMYVNVAAPASKF